MFDVKNYQKQKNSNISRTIRFPEELFDQVNKLSAKNNISFNSFVLSCIKYSIDNMKK